METLAAEAEINFRELSNVEKGDLLVLVERCNGDETAVATVVEEWSRNFPCVRREHISDLAERCCKGEVSSYEYRRLV